MKPRDPHAAALECLDEARKQFPHAGLGPRSALTALTAVGRVYATLALADAVRDVARDLTPNHHDRPTGGA